MHVFTHRRPLPVLYIYIYIYIYSTGKSRRGVKIQVHHSVVQEMLPTMPGIIRTVSMIER